MELMIILEALQNASTQIFANGYHGSSDKIFHMSCHGVLEYGHPQIVMQLNLQRNLCFTSWEKLLGGNSFLGFTLP